MKDRHRRALKAGSGNAAKLQIVDRLRTVSQRHRLYQVFCDFIAMSAIAISNQGDLIRAPEREHDYLDIIRRYDREEVAVFCETLGLLQLAYRADSPAGHACVFDDVLGETFMALEFGNDYAGQFFTPMEACRLTARLTFEESLVRGAIAQSGYVSVGEPAAGAGAMIIAATECIAEMGIDYRKHLVVTAVDISLTAVHMAYLQCAFLGIPAVIVHGNSLTLQEHSAWLTPMYVSNGHATRDVIRRREHYLTEELRRPLAVPASPASGASGDVRTGMADAPPPTDALLASAPQATSPGTVEPLQFAGHKRAGVQAAARQDILEDALDELHGTTQDRAYDAPEPAADAPRRVA